MVSWYRRFVLNFATVVQPMTNLLKKDQKWEWTDEQQQAFETLKERLTQAPVPACPDFAKRFILQTDASSYGLGAVLTQQIKRAERLIAYASRRLLKLRKPTGKRLLNAFEEMPELNALKEEQAWPIAPVAWQVSTPDPAKPTESR
ncbi:GL15971 [Drosophila persimilis]|uniref:RNA-directed DNA polymerase n=1 Tax=Drosophila persimilis TaxID=7234 RepID=B4HBS3_DROPE|nr:GL15971 [Drosophila persimilis]